LFQSVFFSHGATLDICLKRHLAPTRCASVGDWIRSRKHFDHHIVLNWCSRIGSARSWRGVAPIIGSLFGASFVIQSLRVIVNQRIRAFDNVFGFWGEV